MKADTTKAQMTGGCLCGRVRYALTGRPVWTGYCHCASCRRHCGSPVAAFVAMRPRQVQYLDAEPDVFVSSVGVVRGFCSTCGTPLSYEAERFPDEIHFYLGTLDSPNDVKPKFHVFTSEQVAWFDIVDELPRHERTTFDSAPRQEQ